MKIKFALLAATTALGALITFPVAAAIRASDMDGALAGFAAKADAKNGLIWLASNDDDDDDHGKNDHGKKSDDKGDDDDEDDGGSAANPSPVGTVAPPPNGLFEDGAAPKVKVN